jgi:hypothetical protein
MTSIINNSDSLAKKSSTANGGGGVINFLRDLDRLQDQQLTYTKKLDRESKRKAAIEESIEVLMPNVIYHLLI